LLFLLWPGSLSVKRCGPNNQQRTLLPIRREFGLALTPASLTTPTLVKDVTRRIAG
jgi:hypothetical protein